MYKFFTFSEMDGSLWMELWMTYDLTSFLTVFQSNQVDERE